MDGMGSKKIFCPKNQRLDPPKKRGWMTLFFLRRVLGWISSPHQAQQRSKGWFLGQQCFFSQKKTVPTQPLLGCPRKLGSMVSKRVITYLQMGCGFIFFQILIPLSIFTWEEWSKAGGFFAPDFGFVKNPRLPNTFHVRRCHLDPKNLPKRPNLSRYLED